MSIPEFSTEAQLRQHYIAVRARLDGPPRRRVRPVPPPPQEAAPPISWTQVRETVESAETVAVQSGNRWGARTVLLDILKRGPAPFDPLRQRSSYATIMRAQNVVAERYGFTVEALHSIRRPSRLCLARHIAMYVAKTLTEKSLPEIGRRFGGRDHTTVYHAVKRIARLMEEDAEFAAEIAEILEMVRGVSELDLDQTQGSAGGKSHRSSESGAG